MIWQLLNAIEKGFDVAGDDDSAFLQGMILHFTLRSFSNISSEVRVKRSLMDKGIRIGAWGQLQGNQHSLSI